MLDSAGSTAVCADLAPTGCSVSGPAATRKVAPKGRLDVLMDKLGIRLIPCHRRRGPGQSHARGTVKEILSAHGEAHLILTLRCIRETGENREALWSEVIGAVSDILEQRPDWQQRPSDLFEAFDAIDLNEIRERARQRRPWPLRATVRVMIYCWIENALDGAVWGEAA